MGYTHYWYRRPELPADLFAAFIEDARAIVEASKAIGIQLADGLGEGEAPIIEAERLILNGRRACGHRTRDLGITWPAPAARGVADDAEDATTAIVAGGWFAGATLTARACGGDCSHETFAIDRVWRREPAYDQTDEAGRLFACCKTAYKPYDVTVTALLIAAVQMFGPAYFAVSSDGDDHDWEDGRQLYTLATHKAATFHLAGELA